VTVWKEERVKTGVESAKEWLDAFNDLGKTLGIKVD
jgi:hypothetical protein